MKNKKRIKLIWYIIILFIFAFVILKLSSGSIENDFNYILGKTSLKLISSTENKDLESILLKYAEENSIDLEIEYAGTIEIMQKLNQGEYYDAVWASNSIWLYMLDDSIQTSNSKSTSINPVVFGIKKSKAQELGWIDKDIYTNDIVQAIKDKKLTFNMSSATQTNTGATAYLGFLSTLAGNPEVLTTEHLQQENLKQEVMTLLSGVERSSGSEEFLESMFLNGTYEAVITYETSIINMNQKLEQQGEDPLYILYPVDGVSISDSPLAYINHKDEKKLESFLKLQNYILSTEGQNELAKTGRRVWYGGINENADKTVFNPDWGIDTTKYIVPIKYPNTAVIKEALGIYQTELRKPTHIIFCLDYSGSMRGDGIKQLKEAMQYILTEETAKEDLLQFASKDKITVLAFSSNIIGTWKTENGVQTEELISKIEQTNPTGGTDIYSASIKALEILQTEDLTQYNASIILMTDGLSNMGTFSSLRSQYNLIGKDIPIFSIMFGEASAEQLEDIANLTNAKVFDGRTNLLQAFKEVRGYN